MLKIRWGSWLSTIQPEKFLDTLQQLDVIYIISVFYKITTHRGDMLLREERFWYLFVPICEIY
jgi:hypothetical protein